jgi:transcriptional regulator with XRE-family HTH domain
MDTARLLRAVRRHRRLSQRDLADHAGVPHSTIGRIESGAVEPRVATLVAILRAVHLDLALVDQFGNVLDVDEQGDRLRDRAFRRFPAHLEIERVIAEGRDPWWGWRRIAWHPADKRVPTHTYLRRPKRLDETYYRDRRWDDAT